jgi:hypothetical protein
VDEWKRDGQGEYNYVTNRGGVLKYWEQRVRENRKFDNVYTMGMRGVHDSGMPGGGTPAEKAERLHRIIDDQRKMLARLVNTNVAAVPQIFCPYKEVLELYRLRPDLPDDITLVWPDDNYGYVRQFSDARERRRRGGAGVYYHVSYWGRPRDYLWLCSTPPALIAEEMTKAYDYGANRVWILNVGDIKPAELDIEFFLNLAWNPHSWNGTNTYELLEKQLARDFGQMHSSTAPIFSLASPKGGEGRLSSVASERRMEGEAAQGFPAQIPSPQPSPRSGGERESGMTNVSELTSILAEYYRLNFQRKPEHMGWPTNNLFSADEAAPRLEAWRALTARVDEFEKNLKPEASDAFFELVGYPVRAAALANEKMLAPDRAPAAQAEIQRLTDAYNNRIGGGKWRHMMSSNPRGQVNVAAGVPPGGTGMAGTARVENSAGGSSSNDIPGGRMPPATAGETPAATCAGADFVEDNRRVVMEAEHASAFLPGKDAQWRKIIGLGYNGEAVSVFPTLIPAQDTPEKILAGSPCLQYQIWVEHPGDWKFTVRALPTFSVEAGKPQRYAMAVDDAPPQIVSLSASQSETDRRWQENVLRNAAPTASVQTIATPGLHTLKIWMVDPGIVIDTIIGDGGDAPLGYVWPPETRNRQADKQ